ncbi:unnamed protein product [Durusdinium trenchii]|uniref:UBX domain-containing protein n=2 Tax=Durusdinium trenchii TaxID=1381693 RepID=A0ABP0PMB5_9DINO
MLLVEDGLDPTLAAELGIDDPELARAIEASYQSHVGTVTAPPPPEEDQDLARALRESLEEQGRLGEVDARASGSSSAAGSAPPPRMPSFLLRPPTAPLDEVGSNAAVDGGSSRGSSRERGLDADASEVMDPHLAAVIEASYAAQTETARAEEEEEMLRQAMEISRKEEERRQNQALREQQEQELQESILMDQMREQEEKRRRVEEEEQRRAVEASQQAELQRQEEEERQRLEMHSAKLANVPPEPPADAPERVDLQIRGLDGTRARRRFLSSNTVGQVYDYLEVEGLLPLSSEETFQLVSTMPRKEYKDREETLAQAGLAGQCALMLERL